jgi:hypothetical protein
VLFYQYQQRRNEDMITRNEIRSLLANNDKAIMRALVVLWENQLSDERVQLESKYHNQNGFRKHDAYKGTLDAEYFLAYGVLPADRIAYWRAPTKQGMRIECYWRQLVASAERKKQNRG